MNYSPRLVNKLLPAGVTAPSKNTAVPASKFCWARRCSESQDTKYGLQGATTLRNMRISPCAHGKAAFPAR